MVRDSGYTKSAKFAILSHAPRDDDTRLASAGLGSILDDFGFIVEQQD
jgi:hypothetical protein